jgi:hypothetical protein
MVEEARSRFLPNMRPDEIEALEELKPDKIENLKYTVIDERDFERELQLMDKEVELQSGEIIVIQPKEVSGTNKCVKFHYDYLKNKIRVSFRAKATPEKEAFQLSLHGNSNYEVVCDKVAMRLKPHRNLGYVNHYVESEELYGDTCVDSDDACPQLLPSAIANALFPVISNTCVADPCSSCCTSSN